MEYFNPYYRMYDADAIPLWTAVVLIVTYFLLSMVLHFTTRKRSPLIKSRTNLVFNILFVILFLSAMEITARITEVQCRKDKDTISAQAMDLLLGLQNRENTFYRDTLYGYRISINSDRLRNIFDIPEKKEKDEFRILVLGDSWTFGNMLDDRENFCFLLNNILRKKHPDKKIMVINAGTCGTCSAQGLLFLKYRGFRFKPDLVLVKNFGNQHVNKAFYYMYPLPKSGIIGGVRDLLWNSYFYLYLKRIVHIRQKRNLPENPEQLSLSPQKCSDYILETLIQMIEECRKRNIPIAFINAGFGREGIGGEIRGISAEMDVPETDIVLSRDMDPLFNSYDPVHPGPFNSMIMAKEIAKFLEMEKLMEKND